MTTTRIAFVSGANRGLGLEIVRQLARLGVLPVMGARDVAEGKSAADGLRAEGFDIPVVAYDAEDEEAGEKSIAEVIALYGRCDVLVNNAAILIDAPGGTRASLFEMTSTIARRTYETNTLGPIRLIQAVVPQMRKNAYGRIVNVSSSAGQLSEMGSGYPAYRLSKVALNAVTRITAAEIGEGPIKVNACCPGWVRTDMGGAKADLSVAEGADTPVWLATLPDDGPHGLFFRQRKPLGW